MALTKHKICLDLNIIQRVCGKQMLTLHLNLYNYYFCCVRYDEAVEKYFFSILHDSSKSSEHRQKTGYVVKILLSNHAFHGSVPLRNPLYKCVTLLPLTTQFIMSELCM